MEKKTTTIYYPTPCLPPHQTISTIFDILFSFLGSSGEEFGILTSSSTTRPYRGRAPRQSVWQFYVLLHTRQSWETHDFCLSWSHYTDTDPTSRERAATAGIEPGTSSPGAARFTDWATAPRRKVLNHCLLRCRWRSASAGLWDRHTRTQRG